VGRPALVALLDGAALALLSVGLIVVFLGRTAGLLLQLGVLAGYVALFRKKRTLPQLGGAVAFAFFLLGLLWWLMASSGTRQAGGSAPSPATVMMMRSALEDYRVKHHNAYPSRLEDLVPESLARIPEIAVGKHGAAEQVDSFGAEICSPGGPDPARVKDSGHWGYVNDPKSPCWGGIFIDCTHKDADGRAFYSY